MSVLNMQVSLRQAEKLALYIFGETRIANLTAQIFLVENNAFPSENTCSFRLDSLTSQAPNNDHSMHTE